MEGRDALIPVLRRYWNFLQREHILAILTVTASLVGTSITYLMAMPQWVTSMAALATFIIGSLFVFRREEKLDAFKTKYNHCMNQFNNYIKRFNKELSQQLNGVGNISKKFATRFM